MEGGGFEPPKAEPTDLQSVPFDRSGTPPRKERGLCCKSCHASSLFFNYFYKLSMQGTNVALQAFFNNFIVNHKSLQIYFPTPLLWVY